MENYKKDFIDFMVKSNVLCFGEFVTKSGRTAPYFINTGNYMTGEQIFSLGNYYADCIENSVKDEFNVIYGPAYKGISLCVTASAALFNKYKKNYNFCFNRKETKDHGEGGSLIGYKPKDNDRILIIEDVVTAGTSFRESMDLLSKLGKVKITTMVISVDRMEKGKGHQTATQELESEFGIKVVPIVTVKDILEHLYNRKFNGKTYIDQAMKQKIEEYLTKYGVAG